MMSNENRLIYISQWGQDTKGINGGNVKKALSQIKTFEKNGFQVKKVIKDPPRYISDPSFIDRMVSKAKNFLPFCTNQSIIRYEEVGEADYYYIRFAFYDYYFYKLLREIKSNNPSSKIVIEYSDYPYLVLKGRDPVGDRLVWIRDQFENRRCKQYIDRIATFHDKSEIEGKPCLKILNGLDVDSIRIKRDREKDNELHALIVASLQPAHGVDRFIKGMNEYYRTAHDTRVYLHVVGGGSIIKEIEDLAKPLGDKVIFHGFLFGDDLDNMYDQCDIGLEILAPHRKQIAVSASLKSREYIARGFPFVSACTLDINSLGFNEYYRVEDSERPIDIEKTVQYYKEFSRDYDRKTKQMREFAINYLSMDYAMKEVIDYYIKN